MTNRINYRYSHEIQAELGELLTVLGMTRLFRVTAVTIHQWRNERGLPTIVIPGDARPAIRFYKPDVLTWAEREGIAVHESLARVPLRHNINVRTFGEFGAALPRVPMQKPAERVPMQRAA